MASPKLPTFKVVLIGPSHAGKTSIINRFVNNTWTPATATSTQGAYYRKRVQALDIDVNLDIWDTAGQERFHALAPLFYRDAQGAMVVFSLTDENSLEVTRRWVAELRQARSGACAVVVVGNKNDLQDQRYQEVPGALTYCESNQIDYFETSAKAGRNIEAAFIALIKKMMAIRETPSAPTMKMKKKGGTARLDDPLPPEEGQGCC